MSQHLGDRASHYNISGSRSSKLRKQQPGLNSSQVDAYAFSSGKQMRSPSTGRIKSAGSAIVYRWKSQQKFLAVPSIAKITKISQFKINIPCIRICEMICADEDQQSLYKLLISLGMRKQQVYDHYGFRTNQGDLRMQGVLSDPERDHERIQIWSKILKHDLKGQKDEQYLRQEIRKGIPDKLRPEVWMRLINPPLKQYETIIVKQELKQIDRDINRTIPTNCRQAQLKQRLKHMLNVLAVAFPEMGYCQGLNFIVAHFLLILNDKQTYNAMCHILYWQGHQKLMSDLNQIHPKLYTLKKLTKKHYPQLSKCLHKIGIQPLIYAPQWFITLFHHSLPLEYVFRIMDVYFVEGEKIIYRVALQILKEKKRIIKKMDSDQEIISEIKNCQQFNKARIDNFFQSMFEINLSRKEIENYENQYDETKQY